ncbi:cysteine-rich repeat secretory protein 38-like [Asparagus officinalis]|uniref:cysteine-rich repeat secretory protein 38-like n=1 Tax=Asparagus officinalis TaxID=4686 RepID=UPI00098E02E7|nr:cysteine-rich repeat secretory protein 38-like [Asparagus officinalis]
MGQELRNQLLITPVACTTKLLGLPVDDPYQFLEMTVAKYTSEISQAASDDTIKFARGLVEQASNNPLMVASGEESVTSQSSSYVLLQCTRDLNSEGCKNCLETGLSQVGAQCNQTNGWRYLSGSCMLRYEVFPFFNTSAISTPGSPLIASP